MSVREQELITNACDNISRILGREEVTSSRSENQETDCILSIAGTKFGVVTKGVLTNANLPFSLQQAARINEITGYPVLFVLGYASPKIMQTLYDNGISVTDYAGNCMIKHGLLCINVSGQKNTYRNDTRSHSLSESAVRLIYRFLSDKTLISKGYRTICQESGQSLGTIKSVIEELTNRQFVLHSDKGRKLINEEGLLEVWVQAYNDVLRPKLILRKMRFRTGEMRENWRQMSLPDGMSWGGDCGASALDGYLVPGSFEIYTSNPSAMLMTTGKVIPDDNGEITLYQKFWEDVSGNDIAPRLVIYADLINGGDSRQIEAAQRLIKG